MPRICNNRCSVQGWRVGWMMVAMLTQIPLPLLPADAAEIAWGVGVVSGPAGGVVWVHGLATFAWDAGDEAGRRFTAGPPAPPGAPPPAPAWAPLLVGPAQGVWGGWLAGAGPGPWR